MVFIRTRTINGKQYSSYEWRWREGGKVKSRSLSVNGPANFDANRSSHGHASEVEDTMQGVAQLETRGKGNNQTDNNPASAPDNPQTSSHTSVEVDAAAKDSVQDSSTQGEQDGRGEDDDGEAE